MLIPHTALPATVFDALLEDYVSREGTDNGYLTDMATPKAQLRRQIECGEVFVTFNAEYQQACLVARHEVPANELAEFKSLKDHLEDEEREQVRVSEARKALHAKLVQKGRFPIPLGKTVMTAGVAGLLERSIVSEEDLCVMFDCHAAGEFGSVSDSDKLANLNAIESRGYLLSRYDRFGHSFYVEMLDGWESTCLMLVKER